MLYCCNTHLLQWGHLVWQRRWRGQSLWKFPNRKPNIPICSKCISWITFTNDADRRGGQEEMDWGLHNNFDKWMNIIRIEMAWKQYPLHTMEFFRVCTCTNVSYVVRLAVHRHTYIRTVGIFLDIVQVPAVATYSNNNNKQTNESS